VLVVLKWELAGRASAHIIQVPIMTLGVHGILCNGQITLDISVYGPTDSSTLVGPADSTFWWAPRK
jgi:hypothetical protein